MWKGRDSLSARSSLEASELLLDERNGENGSDLLLIRERSSRFLGRRG